VAGLVLTGAISCRVAPREELTVATDVARWLDAAAVTTDAGVRWPADHADPQTFPVGLGDGSAGIVLFFLNLHDATDDPNHLSAALAGADHLLSSIPASLGNLDALPVPTSLYSGFPAVALALHEAFERTGDERYRGGVRRIIDLVHGHAQRDADGAWWSTYNDVLNGNAGTGLFLLFAARELGHDPSLELATSAGRKLLSRRIETAYGRTWKLREDSRFVLPNFSHGSAGIGFYLATLYQATGDDEFLEAALQAGAFLESVADTADGGFLVPYGWPDEGWRRPHDVGWAHGPAGTARFFFRLWEITQDNRWLAHVHQSAASVMASGLHGTPAPAFGTDSFDIDRRFGLGSVAEFFMDLHRASGEGEYLDSARSVMGVIVQRATREEAGTYWTIPRFGFMENAGSPASFTGYFYGAAGFGLLMLQMDALQRDAPRPTTWPDNPF
jgi:hypothetical protein